MKRLGNNFDEWEREANYLKAMGKIDIRSVKGLDDQSHLYKDLIKDNRMTWLDVALAIVFVILPLCAVVFLLLSF